jgi:hypothetical protein
MDDKLLNTSDDDEVQLEPDTSIINAVDSNDAPLDI